MKPAEDENKPRLDDSHTIKESGKERVLIMTAVAAEREAILRGIQNNPKFDVLLTGVGPISAAVRTAKALSTAEYSLVINAGIGGGFVGQAELESIVVANEMIGADLGAQTPDGFSSLVELGFGSNRVPVDEVWLSRVTEALQAAGLPVRTGPILTVSTVTGTAETALELSKRVQGAMAEGMEGYGVGFAALEYGVPVLEIRTISNAVGPRNRDAWRMKEALKALEAASSILLEVIK